MEQSIRFTLLMCFFWITYGCDGQIEEAPVGEIRPTSIEEKQNVYINSRETSEFRRINSPLDFRYAAQKVTPGVVHIISSWKLEEDRNDIEDMEAIRKFFGEYFWHHFFEPYRRKGPLQASASGVIVTDDGYIITNNHVVEGAEVIDVVLHDQRTYKAEVIGNDPKTDIALVKIAETGLTFIPYGNSDEIAIGEWVLAVGNPFNLSSTVTAGIVSAKARNINVMTDSEATESYIQTDAAVNPGNSGGALVDLRGRLIGINTAIATPTGAFAGYSFAIPVGIVKKVAEDLLQYGVVQRVSLGIIITDMTGSLAQTLKKNFIRGIYVDSLIHAGAAMEAGLEKGDVISKIDNTDVVTTGQLQEILAEHRPGEKLNITIIRNDQIKNFVVTLKASEEDAMKNEAASDTELLKLLGIEAIPVSDEEKRRFHIKNGLKVVKIISGKIHEFTNMQPGFVIIRVNGIPVTTKEDLVKILTSGNRVIIMAGIYPGLEGEVSFGFGI